MVDWFKLPWLINWLSYQTFSEKTDNGNLITKLLQCFFCYCSSYLCRTAWTYQNLSTLVKCRLKLIKNVNLKCQKLKYFREYIYRSIIRDPQSQRILNHTPWWCHALPNINMNSQANMIKGIFLQMNSRIKHSLRLLDIIINQLIIKFYILHALSWPSMLTINYALPWPSIYYIF